MIFDKSNCELINTKDVYLHDDWFISLEFNRDEKILILHMIKYNNKQPYLMKFNDVAGFEMTSSDFWGASDTVLDYEYVTSEKAALISRLQNTWLDTPYTDKNFCFEDHFFETLFTFTSGDSLRVVAKTVEFTKQ